MQDPFVIQHHEENKRIGSSKDADGQRPFFSCNGYKKICKRLNIPLSAVRAIINMELL